MNHTQQLLWNKVIIINDDDVTIKRSSIFLYRFWIDSQEEMTQNFWWSLMHQKRLKMWTDKEESKNFMSKFMRFNEQQLKMCLVKSIIEQMKRMTFRQRSSSSSLLISSSFQSQWQQSFINSLYSTYQSLSYSQWQQSVSISLLHQRQEASSSFLFFTSSFQLQRFSLIESSEEKKAVIEQFFLLRAYQDWTRLKL